MSGLPLRDADTQDSGLRLFTVIYAGATVVMTPIWMLAAHLAFEQSRAVLAKAMYLVVGFGFLVALKFLGLERQYDLTFGVVAVLVNAFVYGFAIWFAVMARRMVRE